MMKFLRLGLFPLSVLAMLIVLSAWLGPAANSDDDNGNSAKTFKLRVIDMNETEAMCWSTASLSGTYLEGMEVAENLPADLRFAKEFRNSVVFIGQLKFAKGKSVEGDYSFQFGSLLGSNFTSHVPNNDESTIVALIRPSGVIRRQILRSEDFRGQEIVVKKVCSKVE